MTSTERHRPRLELTLFLRDPPRSKKAAKSPAWQDVRNRICEAIEAIGLTVPYSGRVYLHLFIEDKPMRDIDNRLQGVFALLDATAATKRAPLFDDGDIVWLLVERRPWDQGEPFTAASATYVGPAMS